LEWPANVAMCWIWPGTKPFAEANYDHLWRKDPGGMWLFHTWRIWVRELTLNPLGPLSGEKIEDGNEYYAGSAGPSNSGQSRDWSFALQIYRSKGPGSEMTRLLFGGNGLGKDVHGEMHVVGADGKSRRAYKNWVEYMRDELAYAESVAQSEEGSKKLLSI